MGDQLDIIAVSVQEEETASVFRDTQVNSSENSLSLREGNLTVMLDQHHVVSAAQYSKPVNRYKLFHLSLIHI